MSTTNHTPITVGAPANAVTFNPPMGQLDAAIGVLSGLSTTDKSSVVAAINEAITLANAQIGTLGSLGTADKTSLVASINELLVSAYTQIGTLAALETTEQSSLVAALNELYNKTLVGGIYVTQTQLKEWTESEAYEALEPTWSGLLPTTADVKWPDGSLGTFTATVLNTQWEGIDAYTITHDTSGYTVTQAAVTRNVDGLVTNKPALTVS